MALIVVFAHNTVAAYIPVLPARYDAHIFIITNPINTIFALLGFSTFVFISLFHLYHLTSKVDLQLVSSYQMCTLPEIQDPLKFSELQQFYIPNVPLHVNQSQL